MAPYVEQAGKVKKSEEGRKSFPGLQIERFVVYIAACGILQYLLYSGVEPSDLWLVSVLAGMIAATIGWIAYESIIRYGWLPCFTLWLMILYPVSVLWAFDWRDSVAAAGFIYVFAALIVRGVGAAKGRKLPEQVMARDGWIVVIVLVALGLSILTLIANELLRQGKDLIFIAIVSFSFVFLGWLYGQISKALDYAHLKYGKAKSTFILRPIVLASAAATIQFGPWGLFGTSEPVLSLSILFLVSFGIVTIRAAHVDNEPERFAEAMLQARRQQRLEEELVNRRSFFLRYNNSWELAPFGFMIFFVGLFSLVLAGGGFSDTPTDKGGQWLLFISTMILCAGLPWLVFAHFVYLRIDVSERGIRKRSFCRRGVAFDWNELTSIGFIGSDYPYFELRAGPKNIKIPPSLDGTDSFARLALQKIPEDKWISLNTSLGIAQALAEIEHPPALKTTNRPTGADYQMMRSQMEILEKRTRRAIILGYLCVVLGLVFLFVGVFAMTGADQVVVLVFTAIILIDGIVNFYLAQVAYPRRIGQLKLQISDQPEQGQKQVL